MEAKATSKMRPSFWDFVNIVYGVSTTGKSSLSAFSNFAFVSSEDSAICKPDSRVSFSDMSDLSGVGRVIDLFLLQNRENPYLGSNAKPYRLFLRFTQIRYLYLLVYIYQYYVLALIVSKSKLVTLTKRTNLSATHCHLQ